MPCPFTRPIVLCMVMLGSTSLAQLPAEATINENQVEMTFYVSPDGDINAAGTRADPLDLQAAIDQVGDHTPARIVLLDGDYRDYIRVGAGENVLIFEADNPHKARISGADVIDWKAVGDGVYSVVWDKDWGLGNTVFKGYKDERDILSRRKEMLYVDDIRLTPRHEEGTAQPVPADDLGPGELTVDEDADRIYFRPPVGVTMTAGTLVEASVRGTAELGYNNQKWTRALMLVEDHSNLVFRDLVFMRSANYINVDAALGIRSTASASQSPKEAFIENVLVANCHFIENNATAMRITSARQVTLRDCLYDDNGERGIHTQQIYGMLAENLTLSRNGWRFTEWLSGHTAAGWKHIDFRPLEESHDLMIRRCRFIDNQTKGFWQDYGGDGPVTFDRCLFENNDHCGIDNEMSFGQFRLSDCVVRNNGKTNIKSYGSPKLVLSYTMVYGARAGGRTEAQYVANINFFGDARVDIWGDAASSRRFIVEGSTIIVTEDRTNNWYFTNYGVADDNEDWGKLGLVHSIASDYNTWFRVDDGFPMPLAFPGLTTFGDWRDAYPDTSWDDWRTLEVDSGRELDKHSQWTAVDLNDVPDPTVAPSGNQAPSAIPLAPVVASGSSHRLAVLEADFDADGDRFVIASFTQPEHGSVVQDGGVLIYTPDAGYTGADVFRYTIEDEAGASDSTMVNPSISGDAPSVPQAPSALQAETAGDGIALSWTGQSDDEQRFYLERRIDGAPWTRLTGLQFDTVQHLDRSDEPGTYDYRIAAVNDHGVASAFSDPVTVHVAGGDREISLRLVPASLIDDALLEVLVDGVSTPDAAISDIVGGWHVEGLEPNDGHILRVLLPQLKGDG